MEQMSPAVAPPRSLWGPAEATLMTVLVVVAAIVLTLLPFLAMPSLATGGPIMLIGSMAVTQLVMGLGGWWLAGWRGGDRRRVLALQPMGIGAGRAALAIVAMIAVISIYQAVRHYWLGHDIFADMRAMLPLFENPLWPLAFFIVAVVAPVAEEILFRGFLLSAFPPSRLGFTVGVGIGTLIWTVLHLQYGLPALGLVALMGVMFSLMLRVSGSLRLPILAHAINNTLASLYLLYLLRG